jgi:preprotein translocase subunit SecB
VQLDIQVILVRLDLPVKPVILAQQVRLDIQVQLVKQDLQDIQDQPVKLDLRVKVGLQDTQVQPVKVELQVKLVQLA